MIGALVVVTVGMTAAAVCAFVVAKYAAAGSLARNPLVGIRTTATRASDAAWDAAHRAGARWMWWSGMGALLAGVLPWGALVLPPGWAEGYIVVTVLGGCALLIGFSVTAGIVGVRAARSVSEG